MTHPLVPAFDFIESPALGVSPLAHYERTESSVTLGLAGSGSIEVTKEGITVLAPDAQSCARTTARLGEWARAQWLAANGFFVVRGASVGYRRQAIALVGGSRCGASVLALVLSRRGWGLISDGLVVIDADGVVRSLNPCVTLDSEAISGLPPEVHRESLSSGRDRVLVTTNGHPDASLGGLVFMRVQQSLIALAFEQVPFDHAAILALESCSIRALFGDSAVVPVLTDVPSWRLARPVVAAGREACSPPELAARLMDAIPVVVS